MSDNGLVLLRLKLKTKARAGFWGDTSTFLWSYEVEIQKRPRTRWEWIHIFHLDDVTSFQMVLVLPFEQKTQRPNFLGKSDEFFDNRELFLVATKEFFRQWRATFIANYQSGSPKSEVQGMCQRLEETAVESRCDVCWYSGSITRTKAKNRTPDLKPSKIWEAGSNESY